jgi:DNA processing protein
LDRQELRAWLSLLRAPQVGPVTTRKLLAAFGSAAQALAAGPRSWRAAGLSADQCRALKAPDRDGVEADLQWLDAAPQRHAITLADARYPERLRSIAQPPPLLFCQGDPELLGLPQLAIVGARTATPQGLDHARGFAAELARRGLVITSGLALGADGAAHEGALAADGLTIAVCATGLDRVYPARHKALAHRIAQRGLLVSEFPTGVQALADNFPRRNRIIAGLALGVLVVEAAPESGSLITARYALEQGREVFAIPGSVHNPQARGCHALIRQGAKLVETVDHILEEIGPQIGAALRAGLAQTTALPALSENQRAVLTALGDRPQAPDVLVEATALPAHVLSATLLELELLGLAAPAAGGRYMRRQQ